MQRLRDVGIVMPVYRQKSVFLKKAIGSILHQSYRHFKLVIVLDDAPREVEKIVRHETRGDSRVHIVRHSRNKGVAKALNRGFESLFRRKDIHYVTWVSSDNIYYRHFLSELRRKLRQAPPNVGLVYSSFYHINDNDKEIFGKEYRRQTRAWQQQTTGDLLDNCFIGPSFMYRKSLAQKIRGGYQLEPVEDYDYWLRLTDDCDTAFISKPLMGYRVQTPYSISKQLSDSVAEHRRWRYAYQLAKSQARRRRRIPVETTILVPVTAYSDLVLARLEALYDQYYSNFSVVVVDCSPSCSATAQLKHISDPRVAFDEGVVSDIGASIHRILPKIRTPFIMLYNAEESVNHGDLHPLAGHLRGTSNTVKSVSWSSSASIVESAEAFHWPQFGALCKL